MSHSYTTIARAAAHTALRDLLDSGTTPARLEIYDASETPVLLATITLTTPCGAVSSETGQLTLTQGAREESAPASGTAATGVFKTGDDAAVLSLPCAAGLAVVSGYLTLNSLEISAGGRVELLAAVIG